MTTFQRVEWTSQVDPVDRQSAIEFVNRLNWLFEAWDLEAIIDSFMPNGVAFHFLGEIRGHTELRRFGAEQYPYLIPGVSRHATNHIVDVDEDGVAVRYHNLLVRHANVEAAAALGAGQVLHSETLPAIWLYSPMLDRLRRVDGQWKIFERHIGGSMTNRLFDPHDHDPRALEPFMPKPVRD